MGIILLFLLTTLLLGFSYFLSFNNPEKSKEKTSEITKKAVSTEKSKTCFGEIILELTEGPYYKSGTPERNVIYKDATEGRKIAVSGNVYDKNCNPIANAWLDFWQADGGGNYDNAGYNWRGHQFTDRDGKYELGTVLPGEYPGRTAHIHVKLRANENSKIYTTQLYFPNVNHNDSDSIFDKRLLVEFTDNENRQANFDFVIE